MARGQGSGVRGLVSLVCMCTKSMVAGPARGHRVGVYMHNVHCTCIARVKA